MGDIELERQKQLLEIAKLKLQMYRTLAAVKSAAQIVLPTNRDKEV